MWNARFPRHCGLSAPPPSCLQLNALSNNTSFRFRFFLLNTSYVLYDAASNQYLRCAPRCRPYPPIAVRYRFTPPLGTAAARSAHPPPSALLPPVSLRPPHPPGSPQPMDRTRLWPNAEHAAPAPPSPSSPRRPARPLSPLTARTAGPAQRAAARHVGPEVVLPHHAHRAALLAPQLQHFLRAEHSDGGNERRTAARPGRRSRAAARGARGGATVGGRAWAEGRARALPGKGASAVQAVLSEGWVCCRQCWRKGASRGQSTSWERGRRELKEKYELRAKQARAERSAEGRARAEGKAGTGWEQLWGEGGNGLRERGWLQLRGGSERRGSELRGRSWREVGSELKEAGPKPRASSEGLVPALSRRRAPVCAAQGERGQVPFQWWKTERFRRGGGENAGEVSGVPVEGEKERSTL